MPARGSGRFGREQRLLKATDFRSVFTRPGRKSTDPLFTVLARRNGLPHPRLGLAIAKKHVRGAVARNRIKRVARESFRHHQGQLPGLDLVVLARSSAAGRSNAELFASLAAHWDRLAT